MSQPIAIIFGSGARVGKAVADRFISAGYRVAAVSRSATEAPTLSPDGKLLSIRADLTQPSIVPGVFATVNATFGGPAPKVVVWNAATISPLADPTNMFSLPQDGLEKDLGVMLTAPWAAAAEAFKAWGSEDKATAGQRTYIYTGNLCPTIVTARPSWVSMTVGKGGALHWLNIADFINKDKGIRFFFADGREADGSPNFKPDAEGHAEMYFTLAEGKSEDIPTYVTFTGGKYTPGLQWEGA